MLHQTILAPGVHQISAERYHADPAPEPSLSSSLAKTLIAETPLDAWCDSQRLNPNYEAPEDTDFDVGHAAHRLVLGAGAEFAECPAQYLSKSGTMGTNAARDWADECRDSGIVPLSPKNFNAVHAYADAVRDALKIHGIRFDPARSELAAFAQFDGVWNRMMADNAPVKSPYIYDLKTTGRGVSPDEMSKVVSNMRYDISTVHYLRVWKEATGEDRRMRLIFVSKPQGEKMKNRVPQVGIAELCNDGSGRLSSDFAQDEPFTGDWFADAEYDLAKARRVFRRCLDTGVWPGYPQRPVILGAPIFHRRARASVQRFDPIMPDEPSAEAIERAAQWQSPN